jgi:hypothetical protein
MKKLTNFFFSLTAVLCGPGLWAQRAAGVSTAAVVQPVTTAPSTDNITGTQTMIVNRSRVLGDKVDGTGTRYFSVADSDLAGKTPAEVAQRLTPAAVTPQQNVKTMDVVVNLDHPLFVTTTGKEPFMIGTSIIDGKVKDLTVNSEITLGELKITKKN